MKKPRFFPSHPKCCLEALKRAVTGCSSPLPKPSQGKLRRVKARGVYIASERSAPQSGGARSAAVPPEPSSAGCPAPAARGSGPRRARPAAECAARGPAAPPRPSQARPLRGAGGSAPSAPLRASPRAALRSAPPSPRRTGRGASTAPAPRFPAALGAPRPLPPSAGRWLRPAGGGAGPGWAGAAGGGQRGPVDGSLGGRRGIGSARSGAGRGGGRAEGSRSRSRRRRHGGGERPAAPPRRSPAAAKVAPHPEGERGIRRGDDLPQQQQQRGGRRSDPLSEAGKGGGVRVCGSPAFPPQPRGAGGGVGRGVAAVVSCGLQPARFSRAGIWKKKLSSPFLLFFYPPLKSRAVTLASAGAAAAGSPSRGGAGRPPGAGRVPAPPCSATG